MTEYKDPSWMKPWAKMKARIEWNRAFRADGHIYNPELAPARSDTGNDYQTHWAVMGDADKTLDDALKAVDDEFASPDFDYDTKFEELKEFFTRGVEVPLG